MSSRDFDRSAAAPYLASLDDDDYIKAHSDGPILLGGASGVEVVLAGFVFGAVKDESLNGPAIRTGLIAAQFHPR